MDKGVSPAGAGLSPTAEPVPVSSPAAASIPDAGRFFIVWSPTGATPPKCTHKSHQQAARAAWDMARQFPDQTFYVMQKMGRPAQAGSDGQWK